MKKTEVKTGFNKRELFSIRVNSFLRRNKTSSPYLSGDAISQLADVSVYSYDFDGPGVCIEKLLEAKIVFCVIHKLDEMLSDYGSRLKAKVIMCGNDDFEIHRVPEKLPKNLRLLLLQNSFVSDGELIQTLPIGIENYRISVNGDPKQLTPLTSTKLRNQVLFGPFGNTHLDRRNVKAVFNEKEGPWGFVNERTNIKKYNTLVSDYKYVAAIRGNGVDTHRVWETLYRGRIPIVKRDAWSESLARLDLPIALVDEWSESEIIRVISENKFDLFDPKSLHALWMPFWKEKVSSHL